MTKLNQVLAIEKGVKQKAQKNLTAVYHALQKKELFEGFVKTFTKVDEEFGEDRAPESKRVQLKADEVLSTATEILTELFDVTAQKEFANTSARADVVIDGAPLLTDVPVTYLLFLEKQMNDIKSFVENIPTLSPDEDWHKDEVLGLYKTETYKTQSTKKIQQPIVLYDATEHHPAQTQLITSDVVVGHWNSTRQSGAAVNERKKEILKRIDKLIKAVKHAREEANGVQAPKHEVGSKVFDYLFG